MTTAIARSVWRHRKGGVYTVIGQLEGDEIYVAHADGCRWRRETAEFTDGRFTLLESESCLSDDEAGIIITDGVITRSSDGLVVTADEAGIRRG